MRLPIEKFFSVVNPRMVALITSISPDGKPNAMAASWHSPLSHNPPLYGVSVSPRRATHTNITRNKVFGVNLLPFELTKSIHICGRISSLRREDKLELAKLEISEGPELGVPLISQAYVAIECEVVDSRVFGDHTWFVGRVRSVLAEDVLKGDIIDLTKVKPSLYLGSERYVTVDPESEREEVV